MNADLKRIRRQALQQQCEIGAVLPPEPVRYAPGLQRDESLEVQQRWQQCRPGRIIGHDALQIPARRVDQIGRGLKYFTGNARIALAIGCVPAEPLTDLMRQRAAEIAVIEDRGRYRRAKHGIAGQHAFGFAPNRQPKLIDGYNSALAHDCELSG